MRTTVAWIVRLSFNILRKMLEDDEKPDECVVSEHVLQVQPGVAFSEMRLSNGYQSSGGDLARFLSKYGFQKHPEGQDGVELFVESVQTILERALPNHPWGKDLEPL